MLRKDKGESTDSPFDVSWLIIRAALDSLAAIPLLCFPVRNPAALLRVRRSSQSEQRVRDKFAVDLKLAIEVARLVHGPGMQFVL